MNIVHATSEMHPFVKTGGLADAIGGLTVALAKLGHQISVFLPGYREALECEAAKNAECVHQLQIELGGQFLRANIWRVEIQRNLTVYLVDRPEFFDRRGFYGTSERDYDDNAQRFIFFSKAVAETMRLADIKADVVHAHDWAAALLPIYVRLAERRYDTTLAIKTVFTIHNVAYQGVFPMQEFGLTNLPDEFLGMDGIEYYGQISLLKAGILFADRVTTVSPNYAREILTPEFGCGLDGVLTTRAKDLVGLINGIDDAIWNPATDALLPATYSVENLKGKKRCRTALLKACGFETAYKGPIYAIVCRLVEQKGLDLLLEARRFFDNESCRLVMLGAGEARYEKALRELARENPRRFHMSKERDEHRSHLIQAGADFFLMPSLFEPCGLSQMYSMRYGTIPLVSNVGGLADTVVDIDANLGDGTGIVFPPTSEGLLRGLRRSLELFEDKQRLTAVMSRGMVREFSWTHAATAYEALYSDAI